MTVRESSEQENRLICVPGTGNRKKFGVLATNRIPALDLAFEKAQCFPFYTYDEDGSQVALFVDAAAGMRKKTHTDARNAAKQAREGRGRAHIRTLRNPWHK